MTCCNRFPCFLRLLPASGGCFFDSIQTFFEVKEIKPFECNLCHKPLEKNDLTSHWLRDCEWLRKNDKKAHRDFICQFFNRELEHEIAGDGRDGDGNNNDDVVEISRPKNW